MTRINPILTLAMVTVFLGLFSYFIWPTTYRSYSFSGVPMRESRLNGCIEMLTPNGWLQQGSKCPEVVARSVHFDEISSTRALELIDGKAEFIGNNFRVYAYNGLNCVMTGMKIGLTIGGKRKLYALKVEGEANGGVKEKSTGALIGQVFDSSEDVKTKWTWDIASVSVMRVGKSDCYFLERAQ